jgi:NAD(P)H dehydrogenase (quinone)
MDKQLVIMGHPFGDNLAKVVLNEIVLFYEKFGQAVALRDLYEIGFNPVVTKADIEAAKLGTALEDVLTEQKFVSEADVITFIYPAWWTGMPAIIKGYVDRVFCEGFAYINDKSGIKQTLSNKKVIIANTNGKPESMYMKGGIYDSAYSFFDKNIFDFLGMEVIMHYVFSDINAETDYDELKNKFKLFKEEIKKVVLLANNSRLNIITQF